MKIGIITEGRSERSSLEELLKNIDFGKISLIKPLFASIEPKSKPGQIAKAAEAAIRILMGRKCDKIVLILDKEDNPQCTVERVSELENEFSKRDFKIVTVVIKNRQYENWLIADHEAVNSCKLFSVNTRFINSAGKGNADNVSDPVRLLESIKTNKRSFDKSKDTLSIAKKCNPETMAKNSRSFRKFLKEITTI